MFLLEKPESQIHFLILSVNVGGNIVIHNFPNQAIIFSYKKSNQKITLLKESIWGGWEMFFPFSLQERWECKVLSQVTHGGFSL